jgi:hypothetical protein
MRFVFGAIGIDLLDSFRHEQKKKKKKTKKAEE